MDRPVTCSQTTSTIIPWRQSRVQLEQVGDCDHPSDHAFLAYLLEPMVRRKIRPFSQYTGWTQLT